MRALVVALALAACGPSGGGGGGGGGGGKMDAPRPIDAPMPDAPPYDFGCGGNTACVTTQVCCATPGMPTTFACTNFASCSMADQIKCDGPDECGGSTPVCCGVDAQDGTGSYPNCGIASLGTSCTSAAACPTHLASNCSQTTKVQLCHVMTDCSDPNNPECCTFVSNGASLTFCIDSTTAQLAGATCH